MPPAASRFNLPEKAVVLLLAILLPILLVACWESTRDDLYKNKDISNCRQIMTACMLYAQDHNGMYPDNAVPLATSSNQAFRQVFITGIIDNEYIFSADESPFMSDGKIGTETEFSEALTAGENHWALTKGLTLNSTGFIPFVFENPVKAEWPPKWNAKAAGKPVKGRGRPGGKIIVGFSDSSAVLVDLSSKRGSNVPLKAHRDGKDIFELAIDPTTFPKGEILDVQ